MKKTNIFIFLFALSFVTSQDSGSIFDSLDSAEIVDADPSEEDEEPVESSNGAGQPLTDDAEVITTGVDEETDTPAKDQDAENETIPVGDYDPIEDTTTETNEELDTSNNDEQEDPAAELQEENYELIQQNKDLEQELIDTLSLINQYRISESGKLKEYAEEMGLLSKYNDYITYLIESPSSETESLLTTSSVVVANDEDTDEDLEISLATVAVIALGFLFLFLHSFQDFWISFAGDELIQGCYTILVDTTILVILWCITACLDYLEAFDLDTSTILLGLALFTFFWLCMGLWLIFIAYLQSENWKKLESLALVPGEKSQELEVYVIMRQLFITPVYTACVTESELKPDFNMASYLTRSLSEVIKNNFHITWVGYGFITVAIIIWRIIITSDESVEIIVLWVFPGVIFFTIALLILNLRRIYSKLVPFNFKNDFQVSKSKYVEYEDVRKAIRKPKYLCGTIDENVMRSCLCCKVHPFKMTCAYLFLSRFPNRHELLFWLDSYGPTFVGVILQAQAVLLTLWLTGIILYYIPEFLDAVDNYGIYLVIVAIIVWLITGFFMIPKLFIYLCLTTKIELMKEKKIIEEVIADSRKNTILKTVKIYRQMKMIYREIKGREEGEEKAEILEFMRKISEEVFSLVSTNRKTIHVTELDEVLGLLGIVLSEDELRLFAKECSPDKNNFVSRTGFRIGIERILYGYEMNPHEVVNYIMSQQFNKKQKISINDMNDFFSEWAWHFKEEDLRDFLLETQSLADDLGYFKHEEIANLMRINIEACPK